MVQREQVCLRPARLITRAHGMACTEKHGMPRRGRLTSLGDHAAFGGGPKTVQAIVPEGER